MLYCLSKVENALYGEFDAKKLKKFVLRQITNIFKVYITKKLDTLTNMTNRIATVARVLFIFFKNTPATLGII